MTLTVAVFSDVICPWCFVGKRRLEAAIDALGTSQHVQVNWLPFQLNPQMPKEGISRVEYRTRKFGSLERSKELDAKLIAAAKADGLHFAFDRIERTPNTVDAHRLIWLADERGVQDEIVEGLFRAYFCDGRDIGTREVLTDIAGEAGLNRTDAESLLDGKEGMEALREASRKAHQMRVQGVPFFIVNQELTFSGAQPADTFLAAFRHALASL